MNLMDLFVKVAYDDSGVDKGIDGTSKKGSGFATKLGKAFKGVGAAVGVISTAAVALGTAFVKGAMDVSDYGSNVNDMSQKLNISKKGFQEWNYILGQSGTDIGVLQMGMKTLSNAAVDGSDAFDKLGISQEELSGLSTEELFNKTIEQLSGMEAGNERTALAADLFGRSATELLPILNMGAGGLEEMRKQAEDYGLVMSDDAVNASDAFGDSVSLMQQTLTGMKNRMIAEFFPALTQVTDGLALLFTGDMSGLESVDTGIGEFVDKIAEAIPQIVEVGGSILQALTTAIIDNMPLLVETAFNLISDFGTFILQNIPMLAEKSIEIVTMLANGIAQSIPTLIPTIIDVVLTIIDTLIENAPLLIEAAFEIVNGIALGIAEQLPSLIPTIIDLVLTIVDSLIQNIPLLIEAALQLMIGLEQGLIEAIPVIVEMIPQILISIVAALIEGVAYFLQAGIDWINAMISGIGSAVEGIKTAISNMITNDILAPITEAWASLLAAGTNLVNGIWEGISAGTTWIYEKITGWVGNVISFIKELFGIASPSKEMADGVGKYISEGVGEGITDNINAVTDAAGKLSEAVVAESEQMSQSGAAIVNALGQGMLTRMVGLGQQLVAWFNTSITTPVKTLYKTMYETGRWMMMGFIIGMLSRKAEIISDAIMLAKAATDAFRDNMRISSPSKVMCGFGEYFIAGFTNAISDGITDVRSAVGEMSSAALSFGSDITQGAAQGQTRTGNTIGGMTFNFNQPVISPTQTANRISRELAGVLYA